MKTLLSVFLLLLILGQAGFALEKPGSELDLVGPRNVEGEVLGKSVDLNLEFTNSAGEKDKLLKYFKKDRPVVIVPGYFTCPRLCGMIFGGVSSLINRLSLEPGQDYQILTVSFDKKDTPERAAKKEAEYRKLLKKDTPDSFWKFLVADDPAIQKLMQDLGFRYLRDGKDFAHSATVYILTPEGQISQYFHGVNFSPFDLRLALVEAAKGSVGSLFDQAMLYCFRFDPTKGKYSWVVDRAIKLGGMLSILLMGGLLIILWRKERT